MESPGLDNRITALAETNFRNQRRRFGIKRADRQAHMYIIGKTGTGKSTLIASLARQDALHGEGFALLDPHGNLGEQVMKSVPEGSSAAASCTGSRDMNTLTSVSKRSGAVHDQILRAFPENALKERRLRRRTV